MSEQFHPLVSIVIPVYNGSDYLAEAVDSALAQTYDNIEVIVVNDGSTDEGKTDAIARSYGNKIRYFVKENGGVASALNMGIKYMKGEYFSWLSHDDVYNPNKIEWQIQAAKAKKNFIYGGYNLIDERGQYISTVLPGRTYPTHSARLHLFRGLINGCTVLIHKSIFLKYGFFDQERRTTQDYALWAKILSSTQGYYIDRPLCHTRVHAAQGSKMISTHNTEADKLWLEMLSGLSEEDCLEMMSSAYAFFNTTAEFLSGTPYRLAHKKAKSLAALYFKHINQQIENTKVSIIIPFFNRLPLVIRAIQSALNQTHKNCEIILIDDGSTEDIQSIIELQYNYKNIIFGSLRHSGPSKARNYGIAKSNGTYISFLDSDDILMPDKIKSQLYKIFCNGALASHTSYIRFLEKEKKEEKIINSGQMTGILYPRIIAGCPIATPTVMLRKDIIPPYLFPENYVLGEDNIAWIKISMKSPWVGIDETLTKVSFTTKSAAADLYSQQKGVSNILNYIIQNDDLNQNTLEVRILIGYLMSLYNKETFIPNKFNRLQTLKIYYKNHGFYKTIKKILTKLITKYNEKYNTFNF